MGKRDIRIFSLAILPPLLSACGWNGGWLATVGPDYTVAPLPAAARWHSSPAGDETPVAHRGSPSNLRRWWDRFDDPALSRLLAAAQKESASVADAKARIAQARAGLVGAIAAALPSLDVNSSVNHTGIDIENIGTSNTVGVDGIGIFGGSSGGSEINVMQYKAGVQSNWEIDLFGGLARQKESARSQLESRNASWHDARVAVAVEVANAYLAYRHCEVRTKLAAADAASREESAGLSRVLGQAGFRAPADVALAQATAADGNQALLERQAQCERSIKGLVAMSGLGEWELRRLLAEVPERVARLPSPPPFRIDAVPARALSQRPDVAAAERDVAEASANIGAELAKQFPKLTLTGNISRMLADFDINGGTAIGLQTWSIGPSLSLPLFDAGKRAANTRAARAQYEATAVKFRATVRTAVREVEEALVRLDSVDRRLPQAHAAEADYKKNFKAQQALYRAGLGSLVDAESSRRSAISAEIAVADLEQEQVSAWIALYRAAGGSWEDADEAPKPGPEAAHGQ